MKKILITGANSYIGTNFEKWLKQYDGYTVDTVDMTNDSWREHDFSEYNVVFHVAGIAHADTGKVSDDIKAKYYKVNTDLTIETAKQAKEAGVKQFIFMSSAIVYGNSAPLGESKVITKDTLVAPANFYGDSKVRAEKGLLELGNDDFKVVILRPPMIYGRGSKGNYPILSRIAQKCPVFPYVKNERSVLYIENLCAFIYLMIENEEQGIFFPQNSEYASTCEMVKIIAESHGKKIRMVKGFSWSLKLLAHFSEKVNKAFGSMCYEQKISEYKTEYRKFDLQQSINITETGTV